MILWKKLQELTNWNRHTIPPIHYFITHLVLTLHRAWILLIEIWTLVATKSYLFWIAVSWVLGSYMFLGYTSWLTHSCRFCILSIKSWYLYPHSVLGTLYRPWTLYGSSLKSSRPWVLSTWSWVLSYIRVFGPGFA